jgi:hypothetical protein
VYGAPAFAERHSQILKTFYKGTTKHHAMRRIRFVTPDAAIVAIETKSAASRRCLPDSRFLLMAC